MVSKLNLLKNYYHIPLEDQYSFIYQNKKYYFSNTPFPLYYQQYISLIQITPFEVIENIYHQKQTNGYILYELQNISLDLNKIISISLVPQKTKTITQIKKEWIHYYQSILTYDSLNPLEYQIIYYTLFTLCQLSIELLNHYFNSSTTISCGLEHQYLQINESLYDLDNIVIDINIHDLLNLYFNELITLQQLEHLINKYQLTHLDLKILLCYALYPKNCLIFYSNDNYIQKKRRLIRYKQMLKPLLHLLEEYIQIPHISWLK